LSTELDKELNPTLRRIKNSPKTFVNLVCFVGRVLRVVWIIVSQTVVQTLKELLLSISRKAENANVKSYKGMLEMMKAVLSVVGYCLLVLLVGIPALLALPFVAIPRVRKFLFPVLPKLGVFFQHEPRPLEDYLDLGEVEASEKTAGNIVIVTPSYGQGEFIAETIDSVLDQNAQNLEYLVQDGGSKDSTVEVLKGYSEDRLKWESKPDDGQTHALNLGFAKTDNKGVMAYLNSDDLLLPNSIDTALAYFSENPDVDVIYGNRLLIDEQSKCIGQWVLHGHDERVLSYADYVPQETMFWRAELWEKIGGKFDEDFRFAMDWDLILRFRKAGAKFAHLDKYLGAFRIHSSQKTSSIINEVGDQEMMILRERELGYKPTNEEVFLNTLPFLLRHTFCDFKKRYLLNRN